MRKRKILALLGLCIAGLILVGAGWENLPVKEIKIEGNRKIEKQAIFYKIRTKVGKPFQSKIIEEDIKAIYNIGYFENIEIDVQKIDDGLSVTYLLTERPLIKKITFLGNKKIRLETLQEKIDINTGNILNLFLIKKNIQNLTQYYKDEGYYQVHITSKTEKISEEWSGLIFNIEEGKKIKIRKVIIEGNNSYSTKKIKKLIKTKKYGFFSFLSSSGYLKKDVLSQDAQQIENFYLDNGYIHADIQEPKIFFDSEKKGLIITFSMQEGDQFWTRNISIEGNKILSTAEIQKKLEIKSKNIFNQSLMRQDISKVQDLYSEHGYVFSRVVPITHEIPEDKKIDVTLNIEEGGLTHVNLIKILGNIKTRDKVIRREVKLLEGDIFNSRKIRQSYYNINNLGFFEEVNLDVQPKPQKNMVDLAIRVKERMTGQMSIGGGYSSEDQFVGTAEIKLGNLQGLGQKLSISAELSSKRSTYDIGFTEPWLFDIPLSAGFDIYYVDKEYDTFTKTAKGGDIRLGYPVADYTRLFGTYMYERINKKEDVSSLDDIIIEEKSTTSSIRLTLVRDSRDNRFKPSKGSLNRLSFQLAGGALGGTNYFTKRIFDSGWHFPVWKQLVLSLHGKIGYASGYKGRELPDFERFYVGGLSTVRGYEERSIGPKDPPNTGDPIGGNKLVVTNVEFNFPIYDIMRGVLFWDAGNVFVEEEELFGYSLRMGVGVGLRFFTPIGPLRFDLGWPLDRDKKYNNEASIFHFAIGTYF